MIESVSTSWVCAAQLHPVNESSDCAQVKTSESAQRLARHEESQKHGILMSIFIAIAKYFGFFRVHRLQGNKAWSRRRR